MSYVEVNITCSDENEFEILAMATCHSNPSFQMFGGFIFFSTVVVRYESWDVIIS